ncbi:MAG TPA: PadR family transcriptional regulator [Thermoplasmata archaeon]|nr:PadR family transcriptional regulator [Thermoplasmata archaeon]
MDRFGPPSTPFATAMRRGAARLLVVRALEDGPAHGYAIAGRISGMFEGQYDPSAGVVYPTLQSLEDLGYVRGRKTMGRIVYALTPTGRRYQREHRKELALVLAAGRRERVDPLRPIARAAEQLRAAILDRLAAWRPVDRQKVAAILDEARHRIEQLGRTA